jgi:hypothetical protein
MFFFVMDFRLSITKQNEDNHINFKFEFKFKLNK